MSQSIRPSRIVRTLLTLGVIAVGASAHAAGSASPFGVDPIGSFEPAKPLSGSGWQPLASVSRSKPVPVSQAPAAGVPTPMASPSPSTLPVTEAKGDIVPAVVPTPIAAEPAAPASWVVTPGDGTFRQVIEAWAPRAGWTLAPWELDNDVPVDGTDSFDGDFKGAVRHLLASTELTDYALQPCFYSNKRVRVVKATTKCDPSQ